MKVTILDASSQKDADLKNYVTWLTCNLKQKNVEVKHFPLPEMHIKYCIGCWDCWWKTPGECVHKDDMVQVYPEIVRSDWLIFVSPLIAGFVSSTLKKVNDRMVALIHPYLKIIQGECHHRRRYPHYPAMGMILEPERDTDDQDLEIVSAIYQRLALNFHSVLHFVKTTQKDPENVVKEITNLKALKTEKRLKEFQKLSQ